MAYDHEAIYKAYPDELLEIVDGKGVFKINTDQTEVFTIDQTKVDAARTTLDAEAAAIAYQGQRKAEYPSIEDQLDDIYHNGVAAWKTTIKAIKDKYPKPS
jgi:hypothetical protein